MRDGALRQKSFRVEPAVIIGLVEVETTVAVMTVVVATAMGEVMEVEVVMAEAVEMVVVAAVIERLNTLR
jgi:hypothetical protein